VKLSTRSRYGTRLMVELAKRYKDGFVQLSEVSKNQSISLKYLEQIVIPLKRAQYIRSARGAGGGYVLAKPPEKIRLGEIVVLLERGWNLVECTSKPEVCDRYEDCLTREVWKETARAMLEKLNSYTLSDLITLEAKARVAKNDLSAM
jgi:Rrf2 family protein